MKLQTRLIRACVSCVAAILFVAAFAERSLGEGNPTEKAAEKTPEKADDKAGDKVVEKPVIEMHQWGVWLADAAVDNVNARSQYPTAMPLRVDTSRPRKLKTGKSAPSPINVMVFRGQPSKLIDIDLRSRAGTFVGHYPPAQSQGSNRLRWLDNSLSAAAGAEAQPLKVPDHWFTRARAADALVLRRGARSEQFIAYDFESSFSVPFKLEGGPDKYELHSTSSYPIYDVVIVTPTPEGRRIGWLDVLPPAPAKPAGAPVVPGAVAPNAVPQVVAAAPVVVVPQGKNAGPVPPSAAKPALPPGPAVPLTLAAPLAAGSPELTAASSKSLTERLERAGLNSAETELLVSLYQSAIFDADGLTITFRLSPDAIAEDSPLVIDPAPAKSVRVTLVIARNLDPKIIADLQTLIAQLGNTSYQERESAEKKLHELGTLAFPALKKAVGHEDPEIVFRAQRILTDQQQSIAAPNPAQN